MSAEEKTCAECGCTPVGEGCYLICPNSIHYYSPEQERADDAHYGGDDIRERYAATAADADAFFDAPDQYEAYDAIESAGGF